MQPRRLLVALGTSGWRSWIEPFLEGPGYTAEAVVLRDGVEHLLERLRRPLNGRYDAVVFFSHHDSLRRDLEWAQAVRRHRLAIAVAQPEVVVKLAYDKRLMAGRAMGVEGIEPIPDLTPAVAQQLLERGLLTAVVAKPPDGSEGQGMRVFRNPSEIATTGTRLFEGEFLLQPYLAGEEYSVNTVWRRGHCTVYPPVSKGPTRWSVHPSSRTRLCPSSLAAEPVWGPLVEACVVYMRPFDPQGFVEFELIRHRGRFFLLEVNPRVSATLRMTAVAAARNPYSDLLRAVCGLNRPSGRVEARRHAMEWATPVDLGPQQRDSLARRPDVWVSTRITIAAESREAVTERAARIRGGSGAMPPIP